jgi:hypothetical protein
MGVLLGVQAEEEADVGVEIEESIGEECGSELGDKFEAEDALETDTSANVAAFEVVEAATGAA